MVNHRNKSLNINRMNKYIVGKAERIFFSTAGGSFNLDKIFKSIEAKEA